MNMGFTSFCLWVDSVFHNHVDFVTRANQSLTMHVEYSVNTININSGAGIIIDDTRLSNNK